MLYSQERAPMDRIYTIMEKSSTSNKKTTVAGPDLEKINIAGYNTSIKKQLKLKDSMAV